MQWMVVFGFASQRPQHTGSTSSPAGPARYSARLLGTRLGCSADQPLCSAAVRHSGSLSQIYLPYVCAESCIFDVTEWFNCQGMRCPANTHKPSFHVNASVAKQSSGKGSTSAQRGGGIPNGANMDGGINEEEFFEWLQNAVQSGMFETTFRAQSDPPSPGSGSNAKGCSSNSSRKKRRARNSGK